MTTANHTQMLSCIVDALQSGLVRSHLHDGFGTVLMPVLYRTGVSVVLRVTFDGRTVQISDDGRSYIEASKYGAQESLERIARKHSDENIKYNNGCVICRCGTDSALWAAVMVANFSAKILDDALANREIKQKSEFVVMMKEKLVKALGPHNVSRSEPIIGASGEARHPDYKLSSGRYIGYLKIVKPSRRSVETAVTMFHDIMLMRNPPSLISAVEDVDAFGSKLKLLSSWAHIIDMKTEPRAIPELIKTRPIAAFI